VLIDVEDVALGHTTKLRWNESGKWIWSDKTVRSQIIDRETFGQVQAMISGRATAPAGHKPHRRQHPHALRGLLACGIRGRRMQSHQVHGDAYYRCRVPAEYALANRVEHPLNVNLREDAVIGHLDRWPAREFALHRLTGTLRDLAAAARTETVRESGNDEGIARKIAECDRKLAQYRAALDSGANLATVAAWIAETEAEKASYALVMRKPAATRHRMTETQVMRN
jgi:site-specific DNA recombinase